MYSKCQHFPVFVSSDGSFYPLFSQKGGIKKIPPQISLNIYIIRNLLNDLNAPDFAVSILRNGSYQDNAVRLHEE